MDKFRWTVRCALVGTVVLTVTALCALSLGTHIPPASAAGSIQVNARFGGVVRAVYAADGYLLWGQGAELQVYTEDGTSRLGRLLLPALIMDIDVEANTAYVAARDGLYVVSLANLAQPALLRHIPAPPLEDLALVSAVAAMGGHAYVGLADAGLWVVDLSAAAAQNAQTAAPSVVQAPDHHYVTELYRFDHFLFSVDNFSGSPGQPRVWDVSDPAAPVDLGTVNSASDASGMAIANGRLFVSTFFNGLSIYGWDPSQPLTATLIGSVPVGGGAYDVALVNGGQQAVVVSGGSVALVDVSNPAVPVVRDAVTAAVGFYSRVSANATRAYVTADEAGLRLYTHTAASLTFERGLGLPGAPLAGARLGDHLYIAANSGGLVRLDVADPSGPALAGTAPTGSPAQAMATNGTYVIAGADDAVVVFDPATLAETGRASLPDFNRVNDLAVSGTTVLAAAGHAGVCSLTLSGGVPSLQMCLDTDGEVKSVALAGTRLYAADSANGVVVVDVSNLGNIVPLGRYAEAHALAVAVAGDQLYVSDFNNGDGRLLMLNRGTGAVLTLAAEFDTLGFVQSIQTAGDLVYLANQDGLEVLQRTAPTALAAWAWYDSAGGAADAVLVADQVYLMDGANGVLVLEVSTPAPPPTAEPGGETYQLRLPQVSR